MKSVLVVPARLGPAVTGRPHSEAVDIWKMEKARTPVTGAVQQGFLQGTESAGPREGWKFPFLVGSTALRVEVIRSQQTGAQPQIALSDASPFFGGIIFGLEMFVASLSTSGVGPGLVTCVALVFAVSDLCVSLLMVSLLV